MEIYKSADICLHRDWVVRLKILVVLWKATIPSAQTHTQPTSTVIAESARDITSRTNAISRDDEDPATHRQYIGVCADRVVNTLSNIRIAVTVRINVRAVKRLASNPLGQRDTERDTTDMTVGTAT